jgi:hypothetical protein
MDRDQLAALDRAATQGVWSVCTDAAGDTFITCPTISAGSICEFGAGYEDATQDSIDADAALIVALVNAYRTGKLVLIDDGAVERVARAIHAANNDPEIYAWFHVEPERCRKSQGLSRAALSALGVK